MAVAVLLFLSAFFAVVLAQDRSATAKENDTSGVKPYFKNRIESTMPWWAAFVAVRSGDTAVINKLKSPGERILANEHVALLVLIKSLARGEPGDIPQPYSNLEDLCVALKKNDPAGVSGYKLNLYKGLTENNKILIYKAFNDDTFPFSIPEDRKLEIAELFLNVYNGYKTGAVGSFGSGTSLVIRLSTEVLFSKQSPQNILDSVAADAAVFSQAREQKSYSSCSLISNSVIRGLCQDPSVKDLDDLLARINNTHKK